MLIVGKGNSIQECKRVNSAKVKDIRWDLMQEEIKESIKPYEIYIKESYYSEEYLKRKYPTEEEYIKNIVKFNTYAVLTPNGEWYEPGKM